MKKLADFKTALALHVFPSYVNTWSSERRKAFEIMYNHAVFGRDVSKGKIIVEGANPGQGKSTLLDGIAVQSADQMLNMILITNSNQRLADDIASTRNKYGSWIEDGTDISYLSDGNKVKANEWRNMSRAYLIAMSTQRYLALNNDARLNALQCYRWGKRRYRDLFVCDEAFEDVTIRDWYYSDLKRYAGIIRESIRPECEWEDGIGKAAEKAEIYAEILLDDLKCEVDRINKIHLPDLKNSPKKDGQMHIDFYLGRKERRKVAENAVKEYWTSIREQVVLVKDEIKKIKKALRSAADNRIFNEADQILTMMKGNPEKMRHDTVITTFVRIIDFSENMYLGQSRSNLKDMANEALKAAGRAYAFEELQKALKNNRANMYENTEHVRKDKSMTAEEFLDVFDEDNVVFLQASNYGDDKQDKNGQIKIHCCRYNIKRLPHKEMLTFLYDGTAAYNPMYDNADIFDVRSYDKPMTHVQFVQVDEKSSKSYLLEDTDRQKKLCMRLKETINAGYPNGVSSDKVMISGYRGCTKAVAETGLACSKDYMPDGTEPVLLSSNPFATYGSELVTGSNIYQDCFLLCKIGISILSSEVIFEQMCTRNRELLTRLLNLEEGYRAKQMQLIFTNNADCSDFRMEVEDCTVRTAITNIVQEINRLRIRGWCDSSTNPETRKNYDITVIWALYGREQGTYDAEEETFFERIFRMVMEHFGSDSRKAEDYVYLESVLNPRYKPTQKKETHMNKAYEWWISLPTGKTFTMQEMADATGISKNVLNVMLRKPQNKEFLQMIQGEESCNVKKVKGRAGYIYTKPFAKTEETVVPENKARPDQKLEPKENEQLTFGFCNV